MALPPLTPLRLLRLESGMTLYDLAKAARISAARLSYLERGIERPTASEQNRLARILKLAVPDTQEAKADKKGSCINE